MARIPSSALKSSGEPAGIIRIIRQATYNSLPIRCIVFLILRSSTESVSSLSGVSRRLLVSGFEPLSRFTFSSINGTLQ